MLSKKKSVSSKPITRQMITHMYVFRYFVRPDSDPFKTNCKAKYQDILAKLSVAYGMIQEYRTQNLQFKKIINENM